MKTASKTSEPKKEVGAKDAAGKSAKPGRSPLAASKPSATAGGTATVTVRRLSKDAPSQPPAEAPARRAPEAVVPPAELVKPDNQLQLTESELKEDIARMLTTAIPDAPKAAVRYSYKEQAWRPEAATLTDSVMMHVSCDGWLLHHTADETRRQERLRQKAVTSAAADAAAIAHARDTVSQEQSQVSTAPAEGQPEVSRSISRKAEAAVGTSAEEGADPNTVLRNQFNFSERGAQTASHPPRERGTNTEAPPVVSVGGSTSHWVAYDAYLADQERQKAAEAEAKSKAAAKGAGRPAETPRDALDQPGSADDDAAERDGSSLHTPAMRDAAKVLERMSSQVAQLEIAMDFKYWDDVADNFRQDEGTLLPLWKFFTDRARRKQVTALAWNPEYSDLFATGYGSFDYHKQGSGLVACFSLKNPGHPEYHVHTPSGVMSLDWHPQHTSLLAVGCYDGSVKVFDMRVRHSAPLYSSVPGHGQHRGPVWGVRWMAAETAKARMFISLAADGRIVMWSLVKDKLQHEDLMQLAAVTEAGARSDLGRPLPAAGVCFDFHKTADHLFLVGTEEGAIHKCSTAYSSEYLASFQGHAMAAYAAKWNHKHERAFLTASPDWSVKLWSDGNPQAIMSFDLGSPVGDVAWAPFSSTVFAAATEDGKVHVYDLAQDTSTPRCAQLVVKAANLTRVAFNPKHPVLLVGDNKGFINSFKLSPNLRKPAVPPKAAKGALFLKFLLHGTGKVIVTVSTVEAFLELDAGPAR
ncbi:hypothetical protein WJX73_002635 [Symbiochloris irregularis]|uniref:Dynein intermediate chain n=1 Tax=Symbiochloris irregularis TaxID=706552 RepID=A0AAW1NVY2_9CHLO